MELMVPVILIMVAALTNTFGRPGGVQEERTLLGGWSQYWGESLAMICSPLRDGVGSVAEGAPPQPAATTGAWDRSLLIAAVIGVAAALKGAALRRSV